MAKRGGWHIVLAGLLINFGLLAVASLVPDLPNLFGGLVVLSILAAFVWIPLVVVRSILAARVVEPSPFASQSSAGRRNPYVSIVIALFIGLLSVVSATANRPPLNILVGGGLGILALWILVTAVQDFRSLRRRRHQAEQVGPAGPTDRDHREDDAADAERDQDERG